MKIYWMCTIIFGGWQMILWLFRTENAIWANHLNSLNVAYELQLLRTWITFAQETEIIYHSSINRRNHVGRNEKIVRLLAKDDRQTKIRLSAKECDGGTTIGVFRDAEHVNESGNTEPISGEGVSRQFSIQRNCVRCTDRTRHRQLHIVRIQWTNWVIRWAN